MLILLLIWLMVGVSLTWLVSQSRGGSAGLPLAYFLGLSLIHVPGALLYLEGEEFNSMAFVTRVGFQQTIIGTVAFLIGVLIARYASIRHLDQATASGRQEFSRQDVTILDRLAFLYLVTGSICLFLVLPFLRGVASVTAVVASLGSLMIIGACLRIWLAIQSKNRLKFWLTIALVPLFPLATLVLGGFIGSGTYWALAVVTFLFAQSKRRYVYLLLAPAVFFVGLSVFVNYMAARGEIRQLVWYQQAGIGDRIQRIADVFQRFEWLDLANPQHREAITNRLNQNYFIGVAAERLEIGAGRVRLRCHARQNGHSPDSESVVAK